MIKVEAFIAKLTAGVNLTETDFRTKRGLVEQTRLTVTLTIENGQKVAYARCYLGDDAPSVASWPLVIEMESSAQNQPQVDALMIQATADVIA